MRSIPWQVASPLTLACGLALITATAWQDEGPVLLHLGMSNASAAVDAGPAMFIVASDEDNVVRVYRNDRSDQPIYSRDLSDFLGVKRDQESDIEGATRLGGTVYWITSHGRNKQGEEKPQRRRLVATELRIVGDEITLSEIGKPYKHLLRDLSRDPKFAEYGLDRPASKGGPDVEGLAATPGHSLLIGFRSPIVKGRALIVLLENPAAVLEGRAARFGDPITLDLDGLGIRSIEYSDALRNYLIIAGPHRGDGPSRLYRWAGKPADPPEGIAGVDFTGLNPEALIVYQGPRSNMVQILSDDGKLLPVNPEEAEVRRFRSLWVDVEEGKRSRPEIP